MNEVVAIAATCRRIASAFVSGGVAPAFRATAVARPDAVHDAQDVRRRAVSVEQLIFLGE